MNKNVCVEHRRHFYYCCPQWTYKHECVCDPQCPLLFLHIQLTYLGFQQDEARAALRLAAGDVQAAAQLLLDHQGALAANAATSAASSSSSSPSSEEPSTSSDSAGVCISLVWKQKELFL